MIRGPLKFDSAEEAELWQAAAMALVRSGSGVNDAATQQEQTVEQFADSMVRSYRRRVAGEADCTSSPYPCGNRHSGASPHECRQKQEHDGSHICEDCGKTWGGEKISKKAAKDEPEPDQEPLL